MTKDVQLKGMVFGGTPEFNSNRTQELAHDLDPVPNDMVEVYCAKIAACANVEGLKEVLQEMADRDINIVGTRGYVYRSEAMINILTQHEKGDFFKCGLPIEIKQAEACLYTRSCGLREKVITLLLGK